MLGESRVAVKRGATARRSTTSVPAHRGNIWDNPGNVRETVRSKRSKEPLSATAASLARVKADHRTTRHSCLLFPTWPTHTVVWYVNEQVHQIHPFRDYPEVMAKAEELRERLMPPD